MVTFKNSKHSEFLMDLQNSHHNLKMICRNGVLTCNSLVFSLWSNFWTKILELNELTNVVIVPDIDKEAVLHVVDFLTSGQVNTTTRVGLRKFLDNFPCIIGDILGDSKEIMKDFEQSRNIQRKPIRISRQKLNQTNDNDEGIITSEFKVLNKRVCRYCLEYFATPQSCREHLKICNKSGSVEEYECNNCIKKFKTEKALQYHIKTKHSTANEKFTCCTCGRKFTNHSDLIRHCRTEDHIYPTRDEPNNVSFGFKKCNKCHKYVRYLDYHMERYHSKESREHACDLCEYKTKRRDNLLRHERLKHNLFNKNFDSIDRTFENNNRKYKCPECLKIMKTKEEVEDHLLSKHCTDLVCPKCRKTFKLKQHLKRHFKSCKK